MMDGAELERRRRSLGMSQTRLGQAIDIRQPTISAWERGHKPIGNPTILALALDALEHQTAAACVEPVSPDTDQD